MQEELAKVQEELASVNLKLRDREEQLKDERAELAAAEDTNVLLTAELAAAKALFPRACKARRNVPGQVSQLPESDQLPESETASSKSQLQDSQFPESKTASSQSQLQDSQFPKSKTATSSCNSKKGQPVPVFEDQCQDSQLPESEDSQQRDKQDVKESHKFLFW